MGEKRCSEREIEKTIEERVELKREKRITASEIEREKERKRPKQSRRTKQQKDKVIGLIGRDCGCVASI